MAFWGWAKSLTRGGASDSDTGASTSPSNGGNHKPAKIKIPGAWQQSDDESDEETAVRNDQITEQLEEGIMSPAGDADAKGEQARQIKREFEIPNQKSEREAGDTADTNSLPRIEVIFDYDTEVREEEQKRQIQAIQDGDNVHLHEEHATHDSPRTQDTKNEQNEQEQRVQTDENDNARVSHPAHIGEGANQDMPRTQDAGSVEVANNGLLADPNVENLGLEYLVHESPSHAAPDTQESCDDRSSHDLPIEQGQDENMEDADINASPKNLRTESIQGDVSPTEPFELHSSEFILVPSQPAPPSACPKETFRKLRAERQRQQSGTSMAAAFEVENSSLQTSYPTPSSTSHSILFPGIEKQVMLADVPSKPKFAGHITTEHQENAQLGEKISATDSGNQKLPTIAEDTSNRGSLDGTPDTLETPAVAETLADCVSGPKPAKDVASTTATLSATTTAASPLSGEMSVEGLSTQWQKQYASPALAADNARVAVEAEETQKRNRLRSNSPDHTNAVKSKKSPQAKLKTPDAQSALYAKPSESTPHGDTPFSPSVKQDSTSGRSHVKQEPSLEDDESATASAIPVFVPRPTVVSPITTINLPPGNDIIENGYPVILRFVDFPQLSAEEVVRKGPTAVHIGAFAAKRQISLPDKTAHYDSKSIVEILKFAYTTVDTSMLKSSLAQYANFSAKRDVKGSVPPSGKPAWVEVNGSAYFLCYAGRIALWGSKVTTHTYLRDWVNQNSVRGPGLSPLMLIGNVDVPDKVGKPMKNLPKELFEEFSLQSNKSTSLKSNGNAAGGKRKRKLASISPTPEGDAEDQDDLHVLPVGRKGKKGNKVRKEKAKPSTPDHESATEEPSSKRQRMGGGNFRLSESLEDGFGIQDEDAVVGDENPTSDFLGFDGSNS